MSSLFIWENTLVKRDQQSVGLFISCPSGFEPLYDSGKYDCERCSSNYYSLGVQSPCQQCSLTSEFNATSLRVSAAIDELCDSSNFIAETVADTIRAIAETTGTSMSTVAIVLVILIPLTLITTALVVAGLIYAKKHKKLCWDETNKTSVSLLQKQKKRPNLSLSSEQGFEQAGEATNHTTVIEQN